MSGEVEQIFLLLACRRKLREIAGVNDDMTGRTGHHAFARAFERLALRPGDIEQALSGCRFHFLVERPVRAEKSNPSHASSFSCSSAACASRRQASTSSACVV